MQKLQIDITNLPEFITRAELSRIAHVSLNTVDNWVHAGHLPKGNRTFNNRYWTRTQVIKTLRKLGRLLD
jgi:DNA-binding transcriptional MerR regulator